MNSHELPMASRGPLYAVRSVSILSSVIVTGILAYFCDQLWSDGFKIPWTFLVLLIASVGTLVAHVLSSIIACCCTPANTIINILIDIPLFVLWVIAMSIVTWNMMGTLGHSCSLTNWGNSRGVMVCNIYKTMYAFVFFAALSQLVQIVLDVRARREHVRLGKYNKMRDSQDVKSTDNLHPLVTGSGSVHDIGIVGESSPIREQLQPPFRDDRSPSPYRQQQEYRDESPGWMPGQPQQRKPLPIGHSQSYTSSHSAYGGSGRSQDNYYHEDSQSMQMQDFSYQRSQQQQQQTHYDSRAYHSGGSSGYEYEYPQNTYYQGRY